MRRLSLHVVLCSHVLCHRNLCAHIPLANEDARFYVDASGIFSVLIAYAGNPRDGDQRGKSRFSLLETPSRKSLLFDANLASKSRLGIVLEARLFRGESFTKCGTRKNTSALPSKTVVLHFNETRGILRPKSHCKAL